MTHRSLLATGTRPPLTYVVSVQIGLGRILGRYQLRSGSTSIRYPPGEEEGAFVDSVAELGKLVLTPFRPCVRRGNPTWEEARLNLVCNLTWAQQGHTPTAPCRNYMGRKREVSECRLTDRERPFLAHLGEQSQNKCSPGDRSVWNLLAGEECLIVHMIK